MQAREISAAIVNGGNLFQVILKVNKKDKRRRRKTLWLQPEVSESSARFQRALPTVRVLYCLPPTVAKASVTLGFSLKVDIQWPQETVDRSGLCAFFNARSQTLLRCAFVRAASPQGWRRSISNTVHTSQRPPFRESSPRRIYTTL